jgi:hypothetical protein
MSTNITASYDEVSNKIKIPAKNLPLTNYALRVFPEKSRQEKLYRSTTIGTLIQNPEGFECEGVPEIQDCTYELKDAKTKVIVAIGKINLEKQNKESDSNINVPAEQTTIATGTISEKEIKSKSKKGE